MWIRSAELLIFNLSRRNWRICSRRLGDGSSRDSSDDFTELNRAQSQAISMSQTLLVEIRQAVNEAQPKGTVFMLLLFVYMNWNLFVSFTELDFRII